LNRKPKQPDFEKSLLELEQLVERLESGDLPLEDALKTFERGVALTRECQSALKAAQARIDVLVKRGNDFEVQPFEEADDDDAAAGTED
jgi:exodeoxyribonuclease VII small subunit